MTKFEDIKTAVTQLTEEERRELVAYIEELKANAWDEQIERDVMAGKLDWLAEEALADYRAGRTRKLPGSRSK